MAIRLSAARRRPVIIEEASHAATDRQDGLLTTAHKTTAKPLASIRLKFLV